MSTNANDPNWWRQACVYQIYPRSFADDNGDGIGDLKGITSRIPYLKQLGVDAIWLSPFYPSELKDGGYDVADYRDVDPKIGTLADFDIMSEACKDAGIKVIVDIVPNHCSDDHPWFQEALKSKPGSEARARFHFIDGQGPDKSEPPSDWEAAFGGPAWTPTGDGQFYLGLFAPFQPDWNWDHPEVRGDFLKTLRFWGDRGVSGFRVDVANALAKDLTLPLITKKEMDDLRMATDPKSGKQHPIFDRDEVQDIYVEWRKVFNEYDPPLCAVAEAWVEPHRKARYASSKGLGQCFSFDMLMKEFDRNQFKKCIDLSLETAALGDSSTTWVFSNHDVVRHATRYSIPHTGEDMSLMEYFHFWNPFLKSGGKNPPSNPEVGLKKARAATLMMLALPGSAYLYQGEELGLPEVIDMPPEQRQDPTFINSKGEQIGRDGCRVPLPWTKSGKNFGYGSGKPAHLPQPSWMGEYSVEAEDKNDDSTLNMYRRALQLRKELQTREDLEWVGDDKNVLHFKRDGGWEVLINFGEEAVDVPKGKVLVTSGKLEGGKLPQNTTVWVKNDQ